MGGRGGSGGSGGSAKPLPALSGSEKQVNWAEEIRSNAIVNARNMIKYAGREVGLTDGRGLEISVKAAKEVQSAVNDALSKITSAKQLIELRGNFSSDKMRRVAADRTREKRRKI